MTSSTASILEISGLSVALDLPGTVRRVVTDVALTVHRRKITCLIGESGSGKSVTSSAIMQLLPSGLRIDGGRVLLDGHDMASATPEDLATLRGRVVSMVFQEPLTALNPVMRVGTQIGEMLAIHRPEMSARAREARILELLGDVHLPDPPQIMRAFPHQLSGGQRQRVVIAMALALEPALIIADEPTTALDVTTQAQILHLFRELMTRHDSGVLLITHDFGVVAEVADFVYVMQNGRVVEHGAADAVLERAEHPYTKSLIAAVPGFRFRPELPVADTALVRAEGLDLTYVTRSFTSAKREIKALDQVSFHIDPGETLGVVGESGSGKSTLAKVLMLFEKPDAGTMTVFGREIGSLRGKALNDYRAGVQMVFQDPFKSLNPRRRVGHSLTEGPMANGVSRSEALARALDLLDRVGLPAEAMGRFPHEFSGGQRQRICIARALAMKPRIVVADEAVSALDVSVQAQVLELFETLKRELGFAMLFITHDLRVASNICDRLIVMHRGRVVETGLTRDVFTNPGHAYTEELIRAIPGGLAMRTQGVLAEQP
ncbi:ABC transporter ATP-binding protein [Frigidibacter sp.]|uniref:dipeptide ABC transporter ATP-binding protein n=1 Tax=Frigidibacter sp. TaxID=2586418 RepID=UPI0027336A8D|nr:ABC transporter ATP-binding protein [Frigidibacter sp.]MDP3340599.1 ABC transporter ATP-binding protein [Frigidibacter sp.]